MVHDLKKKNLGPIEFSRPACSCLGYGFFFFSSMCLESWCFRNGPDLPEVSCICFLPILTDHVQLSPVQVFFFLTKFCLVFSCLIFLHPPDQPLCLWALFVLHPLCFVREWPIGMSRSKPSNSLCRFGCEENVLMPVSSFKFALTP